MYNYRNAAWNKHGTIDCEIEHPQYGWIPFTAAENDSNEDGVSVFVAIRDAGDAAPYNPPPPTDELTQWRATVSCTPLQGQLALGEQRWIEVEAILDNPATPWAMRQTIRSASLWKRNSPEIMELGSQLGLSDIEIDDLFRLAVTLNL